MKNIEELTAGAFLDEADLSEIVLRPFSKEQLDSISALYLVEPKNDPNGVTIYIICESSLTQEELDSAERDIMEDEGLSIEFVRMGLADSEYVWTDDGEDIPKYSLL